MEDTFSVYFLKFRDGSSMELEWRSSLITPKELESYLNKISDKFDILHFIRRK